MTRTESILALIGGEQGLQALAEAGRDEDLAQALNAVHPHIHVSRGRVPRDVFAGDFFEILLGIYLAPESATAAKWRAVLEVLKLKDTVNFASPKFAALMEELVADGYATEVELGGLTQRDGSLLEQVLGPGATTTAGELAEVLRG